MMPPIWPLDKRANLVAFYGNPSGANGEASRDWEIENLAMIEPPFIMVAAWDVGKRIRTLRVHRRCAKNMLAALNTIWAGAGYKQENVEKMRAHLCGGTYNYRVKRGLASLSIHAYGAAIDIDPARNGLGVKRGSQSQIVIDAFKEQGAVWGGDWVTRPDPMHFQFARE